MLQPLPIWASQPNQAVWDPSYLQKMDPRYSGVGSYPNGSSVASGTNGGGVMSTSYYAKSSTSSHNRRSKVIFSLGEDRYVEVHIRPPMQTLRRCVARIVESFTLAVNPVLCSQVPPTMLPDGTLVVPIRDDADGSDDEEELSGIIEVSGINNFGQDKSSV